MSSREWREVKLGDICNVTSSKRIFAREYLKSGVPFYRGKEIIEKHKDKIISTELFISDERYKEIKKAYGVPEAGDILLTSVGTLGIPYIVRNEKFYFKDGNLTWIKDYNKNLNNKFLYYWLISPLGKSEIMHKTIGSTQQALTIQAINSFLVSLPPHFEQQAIADTLSCLDDMIELNNRTNQILEEIAQTIFKQWFVDFEFPNEDGQPFKSSGGEMVDSELGEIPNGWRVNEIGEIADVIDCLHSKKPTRSSTGPILLQLNNIRDDGLLDISDVFMISDDDYKKWISRVEATKGDCVITNVGRVGAVSQIPENFTAALGRNMTCVRCKVSFFYPTFLIECLLSDIMRKEINLKTDSGTILDALNVKNIPKLRFVCPSTDIAESFEQTVRPIRNLMEDNLKQSNKLSTIRDTLLPKLMSGEIRVPYEKEAI